MVWNQNTVETCLQKAVEAGEAAGISAMAVQYGRELGFAALGWADREQKRPMARDTIFRFYSMTKPFTAFGILRLLEEGRIDLADPVSLYLPEYAALSVGESRATPRQPLTIHQLLSMTSGLTYGGTDSGAQRGTQRLLDELEQIAGTPRQPSTREAVRRLAGVPLQFQPGSHW